MRAIALLVSYGLLLAGGTGSRIATLLPSWSQQPVDAYLFKRKPWEDGSPTVVGLP